ncbi:glutamine amidotransferase [Candidatus Saccharibacteria bacterium 32-49-12]|nr:MAG: glutamine amidotransferase [Candidatus Saccharibacteria bacterium 32-49-12]
MTNREITIVHLYPEKMNIYGDNGNVLVLKRRLEWHGYEPHVIDYNVGDAFPEHVDILVGGGGQDSGQISIHDDLMKVGPRLQELADHDTPMLLVCGLYQLFGKFFKTADGTNLKGIGIFDIETHATNERLIGNVISHNDTFGDIIGYENHSGQTYLGERAQPFARVKKGAGNNSQDKHEGARYRNVIGTYLHGSLLPKNPRIADFMIEIAVRKRYGDFSPQVIDDLFADLARDVASQRPR